MILAPYRPKSLDELNQAYDKAKAAERASKPQTPASPQPQQTQPAQTPPQPRTSIADAVRARENNQALSGAVDDFIKQFSSKEAVPQSAYAQAKQTTQAKETEAKQAIAREAEHAFDDVLTFPEISTTPPEPPAYQRYTHEEAPIKEGDLSGLMDEYIAVMTDQNGEEETKRSFLRRRKDRKKNKAMQQNDSETAAGLFDLPEEPAASMPPVEQPPVVSYTPPVAPVQVPYEAPVTPVEVPYEAPVAPVEVPYEAPAAPVEIPYEEPVAPVEIPYEEPVAPVEIPYEEPVAPVEIPYEEPVAPVVIPVEAPAAPVEAPTEVPAAPQAPVAPTVPQMPAYTPYHSPLEEKRKEMDMAPPVRTEKKPKRKINMEPEPVFDPHRLFADLEDEEPQTVPAAPVELPQEPPTPPVAPAPAPVQVPQQPEEPISPPAPAPMPEPAAQPQAFEDIVSYSNETEDDRFIPQQPAEEPAPSAALQETPDVPQDEADDEDFDLASLDLQQEVVIRPSKVKVFFKILVALLMIVSLLATAAVGMMKLVLNINTGKSAFGDYYFFAVSNDYANVNIRGGDLILAKRKLPVELGETAVYVDPNTRSFSFGRNEASSPDPEIYNALIYNLSGIAVREENVLGVVEKTIPQGGVVVRMVLNDFYTYLGACAGAFLFLLLIRVIFLRKKRRYLTVEELAAQSVSGDAPKKGKAKKQKPAKAEKAPKEKKAKKAKKQKAATAAPSPAPADAPQDEDLFSDID